MLSEENSDAGPPPEETAEPAWEEEIEPSVLEAIPAEEQNPGQILELCPACGTLMDVTDQAPMAKIYCPSCGQNLRTRRQFNNYSLLEQIGEGGMGSVFKALDCNLQRHVALKILKKECSANGDEQAQLEQEARLTASINHPHVVKVFSFGRDHEQFYLAMELVEKGSLDQLMNLQQQVAEAQVLAVGIQIAEGLEAALERGLIHRDIKPANILFSDAHTAKLVDFGLAVVMEEAAQDKGEIWGTPYYIAPEKLDHLPEDFRSDIYSLGGTLFHALAGRPPYEAETASMVALKQLKSQPISLQAFAPNVSSETAYVINRMLSKEPDDRYPSYQELIDHLSYARQKLLERSHQPAQPKARVVLETQEGRTFKAFLSLGLLAVLLAAIASLYLFRARLFGTSTDPTPVPAAKVNTTDPMSLLRDGVQQAADRQFDAAQKDFQQIGQLPGIAQPMVTWALMNEGLVALAQGNPSAVKIFHGIAAQGPYATDSAQGALASFFVAVAKTLSEPKSILPQIQRVYSSQSYEAFSLFCFALHDWQSGDLADAGKLLEGFLHCSVPSPDDWIEDYKPLAGLYLSDYHIISTLEAALPSVTDAASAQALMKKVHDSADDIRTPGLAPARLQALEKELVAKGAKAP